jgi:hypothetical protein
VSIFSECDFKGGDGVCFGGVLEGRASTNFSREGGDDDRLLSTSSRGSAIAIGDGALDAGDSVAIGGNVIPPPCDARPAPMGRGWGGNRAGKGELGGYESAA